jgi:DNA-binding NarL/FixJ family response regulator
VGEASDGLEVVRVVRETGADVVLMDIRMPEIDGIEATRRIVADESLTGVRVLVLTTFETDDLVFAALRAGASGFLGKGVDAQGLLTAIRTVAGGEQLLSPGATRAVIDQALRQPDRDASGRNDELGRLTEREREITALAARGLSNAEIATRLYISPATAKTHIGRAMMKTGSRDRAQLVVFAYESGLMDPRV